MLLCGVPFRIVEEPGVPLAAGWHSFSSGRARRTWSRYAAPRGTPEQGRGDWLTQNGLHGLEDDIVRDVPARCGLPWTFEQHPPNRPAA